MGRFLARERHHRGGTHGNAVDHLPGMRTVSEDFVSRLRPSEHVKAVIPSHLDMISLAQAVAIEVWQEDIIFEIMIIEECDMQHSLCPHLVAMHYDGCLVSLLRRKEVNGMGTIARRHDEECVPHLPVLIYGIHPFLYPRTLLHHALLPMLGGHSLGFGIVQRIIEHIGTRTYKSSHNDDKHHNG